MDKCESLCKQGAHSKGALSEFVLVLRRGVEVELGREKGGREGANTCCPLQAVTDRGQDMRYVACERV
jgi:hypothetical protein